MRILSYTILIFMISACAVQGPISGGPIDLAPPKLVSSYPSNFSTNIALNEKIILIFDEQIDPISANEAIKINYNDFKIKVRGKKVIIEPKSNWDPNYLIDIYIGRSLKDYQKNSLKFPINIFLSLSDSIPPNKIGGNIVDIQAISDSLKISSSDQGKKTSGYYEVGLYRLLNDQFTLIKKVESNVNLEFKFEALDTGKYRIGLVEASRGEGLIDINTDFRSKKYSILSDDINLNLEINKAFVSLFVAQPIRRDEIQGINFINQYLVKYILAPPNSTKIRNRKGIFMEGYYSFINNENIAGDSASITLQLFNAFETYNTNSFDFIVPLVYDIDAPLIEKSRRIYTQENSLDWDLKFSEPIKYTRPDSTFYILRDSTKIYLKSQYKKPPKRIFGSDNFNQISDYSMRCIIPIDTLELFYSDSLYIDNNNIFDLSGNILIDSILVDNVSFDEGDDIEAIEKGFGGIYGEVEFSDSIKSIIVVAKNIEDNFKSIYQIRDYDLFKNNKFRFKELPAGQYLLYCYENYSNIIQDYESRSDREYPYFGGKWEPFEASSKFSEVLGPIEVRTNWDTKSLNLKLKESVTYK